MSEVAEHFRATVCARLGADQQEPLRVAAGGGAAGELRRTLHLADRAVRQWAHHGAVHGRNGHRSAYGGLPPLVPELGHAVQGAADTELKAGLGAEHELIAQMVWGIGERLSGIDTAAPPSGSQDSLNRIAVEAAEILLAAGLLLADPDWVADQANEALSELGNVQ